MSTGDELKLKSKLCSILEGEFNGKIDSPQDLRSHTDGIADELLSIARDFWSIEDVIDATSMIDFSTKALVNRCSTLLKGCNELKTLTIERFPAIGQELNTIFQSLQGIEYRLIKHDRRRPSPASLRRPQAEELALRIICTLRKHQVDIKGSQRHKTSSAAVAILAEIFDTVFTGFFSQPGSITNLITDLRNREQEKFSHSLEGIGLDLTNDELSTLFDDIRDYTF